MLRGTACRLQQLHGWQIRNASFEDNLAEPPAPVVSHPSLNATFAAADVAAVADTDINATFAGAGLVVAAELFVVAGDAPLLQP